MLQEIDDGVIILEEKEDKEESFINVEFANSFMKYLFGSKFNSDSPESAKRVQELAKKPIVIKTVKQLMRKKDNDSVEAKEETSL